MCVDVKLAIGVGETILEWFGWFFSEYSVH